MKTQRKQKIVNGIAKVLRTPGMFRMQVITNKPKQEQKTACRKPVTTEPQERVVI